LSLKVNLLAAEDNSLAGQITQISEMGDFAGAEAEVIMPISKKPFRCYWQSMRQSANCCSR
jgi:hypothetical protein